MWCDNLPTVSRAAASCTGHATCTPQATASDQHLSVWEPQLIGPCYQACSSNPCQAGSPSSSSGILTKWLWKSIFVQTGMYEYINFILVCMDFLPRLVCTRTSWFCLWIVYTGIYFSWRVTLRVSLFHGSKSFKYKLDTFQLLKLFFLLLIYVKLEKLRTFSYYNACTGTYFTNVFM